MRPGIMERIEAIRSHWYEGASSSYLAARVGCSRGSIIGIYNRYRDTHLKDCPLRSADKTAKATEARIEHGTKRHTVKPLRDYRLLSDQEYDATALMVSLIDRQPRMCCWPIGDPKTDEFGYCGHDRKDGSPYCPVHASRLVGAGTASEQSAIRDARKAA